MAETPEVTILLLGDAEVGKSTFLSYAYPFSFLSTRLTELEKKLCLVTARDSLLS